MRDLINEIHSQGMLLNVEDSIINTNIKSDLFYIKNKMKQSQDIRDQVKAISDSFKISTEIDVWKNYHILNYMQVQALCLSFHSL